MSSDRADSLQMDHVYLTFGDYLWAHYFIVPNCFMQGVWGFVRLYVKQALHKAGLINVTCDYPCVVANLLLEGIGESLHYVCTDLLNNRRIATFLWTDFPMLMTDGKKKVAGYLRIRVDLDTRRMESATLDDRELTAKDALTLVFFDNVSAGHVTLHAYGNWACNLEGDVSSFVRTMGVATVFYNYLGATVYPRLMRFLHLSKLSRYDLTRMPEIFAHGCAAGVQPHTSILELRTHSKVVDFVIRLRRQFLMTFCKHQSKFPGVDGEALFIGTILHSLDHTLAGEIVSEPLWLDVSSPEFGAMAEHGRIARTSFVDDLPCLLFHKLYKDAPDQFFKEVYSHAFAINPKLADSMDAALIK